MENASRALLITGSILITVIIISALVFTYRDLTSVKRQEAENEKTKEIEQFNKSYESYIKKDLYGKQLISLAFKLDEYNKSINNNNYDSTIVDPNKKENEGKKVGKEGYNYIYLNADGKSIKYYIGMQNFIDEYFGKGKMFESVNEFISLKEALCTMENTNKNDIEYKKAEIIKNNILNNKTNKEVYSYSNINELYEGSYNEEKYNYKKYEELTQDKNKFKCTDVKYASNGRINYMVFEKNQ